MFELIKSIHGIELSEKIITKGVRFLKILNLIFFFPFLINFNV